MSFTKENSNSSVDKFQTVSTENINVFLL